ncbi:Oidioi.mRNA.OKI2018_I69.PAR.g8517.t2.cds [Oikopleura dioica]|uniref:Oidioi.mRNA.OKI2018_I69.PAR.g8517.t2.cds n=1 Tax=Oikopleura dioica TaxID=34765 RepID=A0ABN7RLS0_OIKDI|nr:Oidioi.mRNA.OKI2018_I69.PAR.g8517.t2.cds [Oikopleura dioica]
MKKLYIRFTSENAWEEEASLPSRIFFHWYGRIMGVTDKPLEMDDLPKVPEHLKSDKEHDRFCESWEAAEASWTFIAPIKSKKDALLDEKKSKINTKPEDAEESDLPVEGTKVMQKGLLKVMVKAYWKPALMAACFKFLHDALSFINPQVLKMFIRWISVCAESTSIQEGVLLALLLFVVSTVQTLLLHQYFWVGSNAGLKVKNSITSFLYQKSLNISSQARGMFTHGEIVNMMTVDAQKFQDIFTYIHMIWSGPLQIGLSLYFLWQELGAAIFSGIAVMILLIPANAFVGKKIGEIMRALMQTKDKRMKTISELVTAIKTVKLYAWEVFFASWIDEIRQKELDQMWKRAKVAVFMSLTWSVSPFFITIAAFATYVLRDPVNNVLTPEKAFVSIMYFNLLRFPMQMFPMMLMQVIEARVSVTRLQNYFNLPELKDSEKTPGKSGTVKIENGSFTWKKSEGATLEDISIDIKKGELVGIVGHIGSGKSSLISAMLNEMDQLGGSVALAGTVAYVPQDAWLQNATLKDNIIFGKQLDEAYYKKCVAAASLRDDLDILQSGDQTEIGEKGINLSGGQKQRVSLARAAYSNPDIILFDDPLSAVDPHVGKEIFTNLIGRESILKSKTRVLATHATQFLPMCDRVVLLSKGKILDIGKYEDIWARNPEFHMILKADSSATEKKAEEIEAPTKSKLSVKESKDKALDGKITEKEESKSGTIDFSVLRKYLEAFGMFQFFFAMLMNTIRYGFWLGENLWLADWSDSTKPANGTVEECVTRYRRETDIFESAKDLMVDDPEEPLSIGVRLGVYGGFGIVQSVFVIVVALSFSLGGIKASRGIHDQVIQSILRFPLSFYDKTPSGRIINRVGKDIDVVDAQLIRTLEMWTHCFLRVLFGVFAIVSGSVWYLVFLPFFGIVYFKIQRIFVATTRQLKRIESVSKSPIYNHFGESIHGASTIRAYRYKSRFQSHNFKLIDQNNQANYYGSIIAYRWLAVRLEILSHLLVLTAALIFVWAKEHTTAGKVGFALSTALGMSQTLNWAVRQTSDLENHAVAVERLLEYTDKDEFPHEAEWEGKDKLLESWPDKGELKMENFSLRYRKNLPPALDDLSITIKGGEKIGICGRTGSGKSTFVLSLFRLVEAEEKSSFIIDGVDCREIGLHDLRKKLTIIPQEATLFSATLRKNLDPFGEYSDADIWRAIELSHLKGFTDTLAKGLDHEIAEGGGNLSAGQRQLVCLARALLRKTKFLILDEATASVDNETDQLVQTTIRKEFKDCTILAVAHRIDTIDDSDKILVMDKGKIAEFDSPTALKAIDGGIYSELFKASGSHEASS